MKTTLTPAEAIELIREAHKGYLAALLPYPDENEDVSYQEYDNALNEALEDLERMVASVLQDVEEGKAST